jgi:hypothetical protein
MPFDLPERIKHEDEGVELFDDDDTFTVVNPVELIQSSLFGMPSVFFYHRFLRRRVTTPRRDHRLLYRRTRTANGTVP